MLTPARVPQVLQRVLAKIPPFASALRKQFLAKRDAPLCKPDRNVRPDFSELFDQHQALLTTQLVKIVDHKHSPWRNLFLVQNEPNRLEPQHTLKPHMHWHVNG